MMIMIRMDCDYKSKSRYSFIKFDERLVFCFEEVVVDWDAFDFETTAQV